LSYQRNANPADRQPKKQQTETLPAARQATATKSSNGAQVFRSDPTFGLTGTTTELARFCWPEVFRRLVEPFVIRWHDVTPR
jgi:hypothetical protein